MVYTSGNITSYTLIPLFMLGYSKAIFMSLVFISLFFLLFNHNYAYKTSSIRPLILLHFTRTRGGGSYQSICIYHQADSSKRIFSALKFESFAMFSIHFRL